MHIRMLESVKTGNTPTSTVGCPGTHGATVTGTHGMGVNTPKAAAVAAATVGLEGVVHMPKGMMLTSGLLSMIVATNWETITLPVGSTIRTDGAIPKLHWSEAPPVTINPIAGTHKKIDDPASYIQQATLL